MTSPPLQYYDGRKYWQLLVNTMALGAKLMGQSRKELYIMGCVTIFPDIFKTDRFLSLDRSARLLYFDLLLNADDYGFVGNVKSVIRLTEAKKKDLTMLADSGYVHVFKSGVVVIMHWWLHFRQRKSRIKATVYQSELARLSEPRSNEPYTLRPQAPTVEQTVPQADARKPVSSATAPKPSGHPMPEKTPAVTMSADLPQPDNQEAPKSPTINATQSDHVSTGNPPAGAALPSVTTAPKVNEYHIPLEDVRKSLELMATYIQSKPELESLAHQYPYSQILFALNYMRDEQAHGKMINYPAGYLYKAITDHYGLNSMCPQCQGTGTVQNPTTHEWGKCSMCGGLGGLK